MRVVFMGTPEFGVAVLRQVVESGWDVVAVYTQPDKPKNRGMKLMPTPVKEYALTQGIPVFQPTSCRDSETLEQLRSHQADVILVAAYGKILPQELLDMPRIACINVHSSLLPQYRGAAPINWAILNGDAVTGVSVQYMALQLDAGDILLSKETAIGEEEDAAQLYDRLAMLGGQAACEALTQLEQGTAQRTPQVYGEQYQYASLLSREMSPVDWNRPAQEILCQIRGLLPWPCAVTEVAGVRWKLYRATYGEATTRSAGTILSADKNGIQIATGDGKSVRILELQADGGKRMAAGDYLRGHPVAVAE